MMYSNKKTQAGQFMPLLMGCTAPSPIEVEEMEHKIIYDPVTQRVVMDMRIVGTKSLKSIGTKVQKIINGKKTGFMQTVGDRKNEIDDSKNVQ